MQFTKSGCRNTLLIISWFETLSFIKSNINIERLTKHKETRKVNYTIASIEKKTFSNWYNIIIHVYVKGEFNEDKKYKEVDSFGGLSLKFKIKKDNGITLEPINQQEYNSVSYSNEDIEKLPIKILGVVKEIRRKI